MYRDEAEVNAARPGENLRLRVQGIEEEDVSSGFVLSSRFNPVPVGMERGLLPSMVACARPSPRMAFWCHPGRPLLSICTILKQ